MLNQLNEGTTFFFFFSFLCIGGSSVCVFTVTDRLALERCLGLSRAKQLCDSEQSVHMFV